jgi:uncharacterized protein (TIGR03086 family)
MDGADVFGKGLAQATLIVKQVRPEHFANPTPDTEWSVRDLVNHMLYELSWVADLVLGKTTDDIGDAYDGDLINDHAIDLAEQWQAVADRAEAAVNDADPDEIAHLSYGDVSNEEYLREAGSDQFIHAWDLGKAIGVSVRFDNFVAQEIYDYVYPHRERLVASGLFAPPLAVPDDADIQTKLLALFGRNARWQPA